MKDIKTYIILGLFFWIVLFYTCNKPQTVTEYKTEYRTDSIRVTTIDTHIIKVPFEKLVYVHSTPFNIDLSDTNDLYNDFSTYYYEKNDSLLKGTMAIKAKERPFDVQMSYEIKNFTINDSVYIRDSVYNEVRKSFLSVGATLVGSKESFGFAPVVQYSHKKGNNYSFGYDVVNGQFHVGFTKRLSFK